MTMTENELGKPYKPKEMNENEGSIREASQDKISGGCIRMKNEKVKLTSVQAKKLERFMKFRTSIEDAVETYIRRSYTWVDEYAPLKEMGFEKFLQAVVHGYDVVINKHEDLKMRFDGCTPAMNGTPWSKPANKSAFREGIITALKVLEIEVKGVYERECEPEDCAD